MKLKKFIGDKAFYKMTFTVAVPIMLQNFITNLVNMLDNIMVGSVGTEQMTGVSVVNQLVFIFNLAVFGAISGVGIFTAQFYGKKDNDGIRHTLRYKIYICVGLFVIALGVFLFCNEFLISLFLHESGDGVDIAVFHIQGIIRHGSHGRFHSHFIFHGRCAAAATCQKTDHH